MRIAVVAMVALLAASSAFSDDALDLRLKSLENELRCLVCQNQTLADSNAPLAEDLRREVRDLATGGKTDAEIRAYLVARYGDFVLYKPPIKSTTYVLWFGPFLLLACGAVAWWVLIRRRSRASADAQTPAGASTSGADAVARARALLDD